MAKCEHMKNFDVSYRIRFRGTVSVEAEDEDKAREKVEMMDFIDLASEDADVEVVDIEPSEED
jgi:hypothetical protein